MPLIKNMQAGEVVTWVMLSIGALCVSVLGYLTARLTCWFPNADKYIILDGIMSNCHLCYDYTFLVAECKPTPCDLYIWPFQYLTTRVRILILV